MNSSQSDPRQEAKRLLTCIRQLKDDRGAMADLRCALNPVRRPRAWPLLARVGGIDNLYVETVAGLFACHPDETQAGNLGTTLRRLTARHESFDVRFRRLLSCDREELCQRLRPIILTAKADSIPVNYEALYTDLRYWGDGVKANWAREYWGVSESAEFESATETVEP